MKKFFAIVLSALLIAVGASALTACDGRIQVSVLQYAQHGSLDNCYEGIVQGLAERGYTEENANISRHIANSDTAENTTAAQTIINSSPAVAVGIATPSAYALANFARGDVPVVFTAVSDPTAESADFSAFSNVTGSSDRLPVAQQLELIRSFFYAKGEEGTVTVAIVYTLTEANSVSQVGQFASQAAEHGIEIISRGINNATELSAAADALIAQGADCFNNLTDNTVVQNLTVLLDRAEAAGIPVFGSEIEQVEKGCMANGMTVAENMAIAENKGRAYGLSAGLNKKRLAAYREMLRPLGLGLEERMNVPVGALSGGQRQVLTLVVATMTPVDVLLLDEHTAALDPKTAEQTMALTDRIVREKKITTLMVTHNLRFAAEYGTRLCMFDKGHIVLDVQGEEKEKRKVDDLLALFNEISVECGN